jgi:hypothetical protein
MQCTQCIIRSLVRWGGSELVRNADEGKSCDVRENAGVKYYIHARNYFSSEAKRNELKQKTHYFETV